MPLDELTLHLVEIPTGLPPAILIHGIGMDWRVWQAISRHLATHFHLYMVDLRGHGQSDHPDHGYGISDYAADIEQLLASLSIKDGTLMGSSLGAIVTVAVEAENDVVSRRILVDPPLGREPSKTNPVLSEIFAIKSADGDVARQREQIRLALRSHYRNLGEITLDFMTDSWLQTASGVVEQAASSQETWGQLASALSSIEVPTLLIRGELGRGSVLSEQDAQRVLKLLPKGVDAQIPGAGHAVHGERPAEFMDCVARFLGTSISERKVFSA